MARSGDWITPRLWGQPWFEKPALLYWTTAAGFRLGLERSFAPRLPVALFGALFLAFFYWSLRREFGANPAWYATAILGSCAWWISFRRRRADLPMSAFFSAAMLRDDLLGGAGPMAHRRGRIAWIRRVGEGLVPWFWRFPSPGAPEQVERSLRWQPSQPFSP